MTQEELKELKELFGNNLIGPEQVNNLLAAMDLDSISDEDIPDMNYTKSVLQSNAYDYLLVMGFPGIDVPLDILHFRESFGIDPDEKEPCLYNQDWYLSESFVRKTLEKRWYLIKKDVFEDSRAVMPAELLDNSIIFPSAILCTYSFFAYYFSYRRFLWYHDFVWCSDLDHNGDRIYVGKYNDVDGINKNGFSVHRHLALRPCYGSVNCI